ncbi:MAG TPA: serine/threonine-protein kinase [Gemmatimonadales bacterium]|nr:serine/threonine-protein kinase [Gemmatimonadales bacterium]
MDPLVGQVLDRRYRLVSLLGQGGMCAVYRAEDSAGRGPVAIKILPAERAAQSELAARFKREAATGRRVLHPNVVSISDNGALADGALYLVMELLDGRPLSAILDEGRLPVPRAIGLTRQLLSALEAAHALGIAHRDIKPDNLLVVERDGHEVVKLVDFGLATNDRAAIKLTTVGSAFGTPEYISPEMAMGLAVDPRADLYSAGVVLFQMVTGRLPFVMRETKALLHAHVYDPPPSPSSLVPQARISPALEAIILRALKKLPDERFQSAADMRIALDAVAPAGAAPTRWPIWLGLAAAALLALAAAWWWTQRPTPPAAPPRPPAKHRAPR